MVYNRLWSIWGDELGPVGTCPRPPHPLHWWPCRPRGWSPCLTMTVGQLFKSLCEERNCCRVWPCGSNEGVKVQESSRETCDKSRLDLSLSLILTYQLDTRRTKLEKTLLVQIIGAEFHSWCYYNQSIPTYLRATFGLKTFLLFFCFLLFFRSLPVIFFLLTAVCHNGNMVLHSTKSSTGHSSQPSSLRQLWINWYMLSFAMGADEMRHDPLD